MSDFNSHLGGCCEDNSVALPMKFIPILHDIFCYLSLFVVIPQMPQMTDLYVRSPHIIYIILKVYIFQTINQIHTPIAYKLLN